MPLIILAFATIWLQLHRAKRPGGSLVEYSPMQRSLGVSPWKIGLEIEKHSTGILGFSWSKRESFAKGWEVSLPFDTVCLWSVKLIQECYSSSKGYYSVSKTKSVPPPSLVQWFLAIFLDGGDCAMFQIWAKYIYIWNWSGLLGTMSPLQVRYTSDPIVSNFGVNISGYWEY